MDLRFSSNVFYTWWDTKAIQPLKQKSDCIDGHNSYMKHVSNVMELMNTMHNPRWKLQPFILHIKSKKHLLESHFLMISTQMMILWWWNMVSKIRPAVNSKKADDFRK